ncbi:MAG: signal peptidase I [Myxococcota bacterium]
MSAVKKRKRRDAKDIAPLDRATRRTAQRFATEVERLARRHTRRISNEARSEIESAVAELRAGVEADDLRRTKAAIEQLDEVADATLGFAKKSTAREYVESIVVAVAIALVLRAFVIEAFKIPTTSMVPTLRVGDHIFVNKFIYGLRVPFTNSWFVQWGGPARGDVIVFRYPPDLSKDYIKRVVAVAGDRVSVDLERVRINDTPLPLGPPSTVTYVEEKQDDSGRYFRVREAPVTAREETSAGDETSYTVYDDPTVYDRRFPGGSSPAFDWDTGPVKRDVDVGLDCTPGGPEDPSGVCVVQDGYVFVMGDNRDHSSDSRVWGAVPVSHVKGKALIVWGSWGSSWFDFRFERLGRVIR